MKMSCKTCAYKITEEPHTCDECKSLANDEDYTMWKEDKADYKKLYIETIRELQNVNVYEKVERQFRDGDSEEYTELRRNGYRDAIDEVVGDMKWKIHLSNIE
jgi:hypothetical protein